MSSSTSLSSAPASAMGSPRDDEDGVDDNGNDSDDADDDDDEDDDDEDEDDESSSITATIHALQEQVSEQQVEMLKWHAYKLCIVDFEMVAW